MQSTNNVKLDGQAPSAPPVFQRPSGSGGGNKKGTSAERRATHNAIERARRESLNGRFLQLAASLPAISDVRRPSKSLIVNKSLDFVADAMNREAIYRLKIDNMRQDNMQLRQQLNEFLAQAGRETLPQPPVDELPVPLAELRSRKRQSGAGASGSLVDLYDFEDDDGLFAAGSEGEGGKNSPTSSSGASSVRDPMSASLPTGVAGFTPISRTGVYNTAPAFLSAPIAPNAAHSTSPGASTTSEDAQHNTAFVDAAGNWVHRGAFEGQPPGPGAGPAPHLTYSGLAFSSSSANNGLIAPTRSRNDAMQSFNPMDNAGTPTTFDPNGQHPMYVMDANSLAQLRNAQQFQQQQLQFQIQLQQHQQQQQQHQMSNISAFNPSHFFETAPLQSASFLTAV